MQFFLHYRGRLKGNGRPSEKHLLRKHFHSQMKELWMQKPLTDYSINPINDEYTNQDTRFIREVGEFTFVPLINEAIELIAELNITMLRPESPGAIITQSGDIDNRLKTLLDSLRMPSNVNELPRDAHPDEDEKPFFCLLEDDNLIQHISIQTDRLLESAEDPLEVELLIKVICKVTRATLDNLALGV